MTRKEIAKAVFERGRWVTSDYDTSVCFLRIGMAELDTVGSYSGGSVFIFENLEDIAETGTLIARVPDIETAKLAIVAWWAEQL